MLLTRNNETMDSAFTLNGATGSMGVAPLMVSCVKQLLHENGVTPAPIKLHNSDVMVYTLFSR